eukprot:CAMPEP_0179041768 /NCGR_PEP_ID=MMETSP0796-20121207/16324_1 /TAXON_ID=73915 /ORGANISM="Pyrodinium bahamense, Strain pbaha01" /LENGTH=59 /DNA_ID=CAMNT_0020738137 /DNA_START=211 /DNA_END=390 /DNA_ORIENTATION=+
MLAKSFTRREEPPKAPWHSPDQQLEVTGEFSRPAAALRPAVQAAIPRAANSPVHRQASS